MTPLIEFIIDETQNIIINKGSLCPPINPDTKFLQDLPMDSLDLATLIVSLEDYTKSDPFREGFKSFHSVGELAALYENITP